ncbi:hypothetical protein G9H71_22205, partial [Motilibacter sp. E257]
METDDDLADLLARRDDVLRWREAAARLGPSAVKWRLKSGRWQRGAPGVLVAHSGPLSPRQELWVDVLSAETGAVLAGLTAATIDGLRGFDDDRRYVLVPDGKHGRPRRPGLVVHSSTLLGPEHVHPAATPPRTRLPRSLVDAGSWARSDRHATAILLAGVQQRLVRASDLASVLALRSNLPRRAPMGSAVA